MQDLQAKRPRRNAPLHEEWRYEDDTKTQRLVALVPLCQFCHEVKHIGRTMKTPVELGDGAFDNPTPRLHDEALDPIGSFDDLGLQMGQDACQSAVKDRPLIGAVGEHFSEEGKQTEQAHQQRQAAVAILSVGGGDDAVQQQALGVDQNMALLALDQLARIEAGWIDASPPFSALVTLCQCTALKKSGDQGTPSPVLEREWSIGKLLLGTVVGKTTNKPLPP